MVNLEYANAYTEVLSILKHVEKEDYDKVPDSKIKFFELNKNKDYSFNYDPDKTLDEQNVSRIAKAIIAILFRDYWATDDQRARIKSKQNKDRIRIEENKKAPYDIEDIFNSRKYEHKITNEEKQDIVVYRESFFTKLWNKLKFLLKK